MQPHEYFLRQQLSDFLSQCDINTALLGQIPMAAAGKTLIVALGKAAVPMAKAAEQQLQPQLAQQVPRPAKSKPNTSPGANEPTVSGYILCRHGEHCDSQYFTTLYGAHPLPDQHSLASTRQILAEVKQLGTNDLLVCLLSGGGSALLCQPGAGITLADKIKLCDALLASGADIGEINCVRKHVSGVKGGQLAQLAAPAQVHCLAISDVIGDHPDIIASGPTVPDASTQADALAILRRYGISAPSTVMNYLARPENETPKAQHRCFNRNHFAIVLSPSQAFDRWLQQLDTDIDVHFLGSELAGEARTLAQGHAEIALNLAAELAQAPAQARRPQLIISGGEATVTVTGSGCGGPNTEYALAFALAIQAQQTPTQPIDIYALAADSDGIDGTGDNAGAIIGPSSLVGVCAEAQQALANNDSYGFFARHGGLIHTGHTYTNVNDFRAILITPAST